MNVAVNFPPYIKGKLPAQYGDTLKIPFQLNRGVGANEINTVYARLKKITTNELIDTLPSILISPVGGDNYIATFNLITDYDTNLLQNGIDVW
jgi:hypothetical protein